MTVIKEELAAARKRAEAAEAEAKRQAAHSDALLAEVNDYRAQLDGADTNVEAATAEVMKLASRAEAAELRAASLERDAALRCAAAAEANATLQVAHAEA